MSTFENVKTTRGLLEWVIIDGEGKPNMSGKKQYIANLVIEADNPLIDQIEQYWSENKPKGFKDGPKSNDNKKGYKSCGVYNHSVKTSELDEEGKPVYEEDGKKYVSFKTGTTYADGKPKVIGIYNAKGRKVALPSGTKIGNNSVGIIKGAMGIYNVTAEGSKVIVDAGVTLYLNDIQLIKLEEYVQDAGFDEVEDEDGFTGDDFEGFDEVDETPSDAKVKL